MKQFRKPRKIDILISMFDEVGKRVRLNDVLKATDIKNYNTLKALLSHIRRADYAAEGSNMDIRIDGDFLERVK